MNTSKFDTSNRDAQATKVEPVKVSDFNFDAYSEYEKSLEKNCRDFMVNSSGLLVYRRMRVAEVFSYGCNDMKQSLEWQLGALSQSMAFKADIPNFLEPWYGIGLVATAFGSDYIWHPDQAPATLPKFQTVDNALGFEPVPLKNTPVGRHTLNMIEYFLESTKGRLPLSFSDVQSPFNNATNIVDCSNFMLSLMTEPEKVMNLLDVIADLEIDFYKEQKKLIGEALVKPGHGFASSRYFEGFGMSDDNAVMIDSDSYHNIIEPSFSKLGEAFGGPVFHSCGNFSDKVEMISKIPHLKMMDGAFSIETDPCPNVPEPFVQFLHDTNIILNARIVGETSLAEPIYSKLADPGMKLILVTYCKTPEEQSFLYDKVHTWWNLLKTNQ